MTAQELFKECDLLHWQQARFIESGWAKEVTGYWHRHLEPYFGGTEISDITHRMVKDWHRSLQHISVTANRSLEVLSRMYSFAEEEEILPRGSSPCRGIKAKVEKKRSRFATEEELQRIGVELQKEQEIHPRKVAFCLLLALTGARPNSLLKARRDQLVVQDGIGFIRLWGKSSQNTGEEETIILATNALKIVQGLPVRADDLLIGPLSYRRFWERIAIKAGVPGLWLRDFRRSFATHGLSSGVGIDMIGKLLNHRSTQTTERYAKALPLASAVAATSIAQRVGQLLNQ